jgi:hypothetical protein
MFSYFGITVNYLQEVANRIKRFHVPCTELPTIFTSSIAIVQDKSRKLSW